MNAEEKKELLAKDCINFHQGLESLIHPSDTVEAGINKVSHKISELMNIKNVHFLLGAGASAGAIPTMSNMLDKIKAEAQLPENTQLTSVLDKLITSTSNNLEQILGLLYSNQAYLNGIGESDVINSHLIKIIEKNIFESVNINMSSDEAKKSLEIYKGFYHKLSLRNKDLSRINIFTTNYDLLSETALDHFNINFNNGFGGGLTRVFNPARFSYTFSRKLDANLEKYEPLENLVYLYKLHGSISWIESQDNSYFNIQEVAIDHAYQSEEENILIYPTPLKQNKSLGSPYTDLIREFQVKLLLPHSVLVVIGYSFNDEHINNVIYQTLASNSSISVVVFGDYSSTPLFQVNDRRIYKISGEVQMNEQPSKIHYMEYIVNNFIPDLDVNLETELLKEFKSAMNTIPKRKE